MKTLLTGSFSDTQKSNEISEPVELLPKEEEVNEEDFQNSDTFEVDDIEEIEDPGEKLELNENSRALPKKHKRTSSTFRKPPKKSIKKDHSKKVTQTAIDFTCDDCNLRFSSDKSLNRHKKTLHNEDTPDHPYKCFTCDRTFKNDEALKRHENDKVLGICKKLPGSVNRKCYLCHQEFESISLKLRHLESDHQDVDKKCKLCGFECKSIRSFDRHLRYHLLGFDFFCAECGKNFKSRAALKEHNTVRHTDDFQKWICVSGSNNLTFFTILTFLPTCRTFVDFRSNFESIYSDI